MIYHTCLMLIVDPAEPAIFTCIGCISSEDLFIKPDGGWDKPMPYTPSFADIKLTLKFGEPAGYGAAHADFKNVITNLKELEKDVAVAGTRGDNSIVGVNIAASAHLVKVHHPLFSLVRLHASIYCCRAHLC